MRLLRYLIVSGSAAALTAGTLALTAGSTATTVAAPASHVAYHRPSARFLAEARTALVRYLRHEKPQMLLAHSGHRRAGVKGTTKTESYNWAGYADVATKAGTFTKVSGSWTAPSVTCSAEDELTADWVGLDGATSAAPTVEQDGTFGWCYEGTPVYFTWYEVYPTTAILEVGTTLKPGDKISASVTRSGTSYTMKVTDATTSSASFTKKATCAATTCLDETAEWISERPSFSIGMTPLAHYNAFKMTNAAETASGKSGTIGSYATNDAITMLDATSAYDLSTVSGLTGGNSFSTTWKNSY
jgi:Peptidase A4 family